MTVQRGLIDSVVETPLGTSLTSEALAGATVLAVEWTAEFTAEGGLLMLGDSMLTYVSATSADDPLSSITLAEPLELPAEVGESVTSLSVAGEPRSKVDVFVAFDEGEPPVPYGVSSALQGKITESTPAATPVVVDLATGLVVGRDDIPVSDAAPGVRVVDPETGDEVGAISSQGDITGRDLTYTGTFYADPASVDLGGFSLETFLAARPRGRLRALQRTFTTPLAATSTPVAIYSLDLFLDAPRAVDFIVSAIFESSSDIDARYDMVCHYTYSATEEPAPATASDPELFRLRKATVGSPGNDSGIADTVPLNLAAGYYRFTWTINTGSSAINIQAIGTHDLVINDAGANVVENSGYWDDTSGSGGATPLTYTRTFDATAARWWTQGGRRVGLRDEMYVGNTPNTDEGNRKSVIWFPASTIRSTLAGATVTKVEVYLYLFSGGSGNTVVIGSHTDTSVTDAYSEISGKDYDRTRSGSWSQGSGRWVTLTWDLQGWKSTFGGLLIGPGITNADTYSLGYRGATHSLRPKLRVTYSK